MSFNNRKHKTNITRLPPATSRASFKNLFKYHYEQTGCYIRYPHKATEWMLNKNLFQQPSLRRSWRISSSLNWKLFICNSIEVTWLVEYLLLELSAWLVLGDVMWFFQKCTDKAFTECVSIYINKVSASNGLRFSVRGKTSYSKLSIISKFILQK